MSDKINVFKIFSPGVDELSEVYVDDKDGVEWAVERILGLEMGLSAHEYRPGAIVVQIEVVEVEREWFEGLEPIDE